MVSAESTKKKRKKKDLQNLPFAENLLIRKLVGKSCIRRNVLCYQVLKSLDIDSALGKSLERLKKLG